MENLEEIEDSIKRCKWCGKPIINPDHGLEKYCNDNCRKEALKEQKRNWRNQYYQKNRTTSILSQVGTTTIGTQPNSSIEREKEIIKNETKRTLKNSFSTTVYKGKYSYSKGKTKFTTHTKDPNFNNKPPLGIQLTHNYVNFLDYSNFSKTLYNNVKIESCPECKSNDIRQDIHNGEKYCFSCGLVLHGFPHPGVIYPYNIDNTIVKENKKFDPMEYYVNDEPEPKHKGYTRPDKTEIDVICKSCYKPHTIFRYLKDDFRCECGSKTMGVGICLPRDYNDEFTPAKREMKNKSYSELGKSDYDMQPSEPEY